MGLRPRIWLIADTHFNHVALVRDSKRPVGFDIMIGNEWRRLVSPRDTVVHLGDVILWRNSEIKSILPSLPGSKILVRGNHDHHHGHEWWIEAGFAIVCESMVVDDVLLTHLQVRDLPIGVRLNAHGHLHDDDHRLSEFPDYGSYGHCRLLSIERTRYRPVLFDEFCR